MLKKYSIHYVNYQHNAGYDTDGEFGSSHLQDTKPRPAVVLFSNKAVTTIAPLTSKNGKRLDLATHLLIGEELVLLEQITTVPTQFVDRKPFKKQFTEAEVEVLKTGIKNLF